MSRVEPDSREASPAPSGRAARTPGHDATAARPAANPASPGSTTVGAALVGPAVVNAGATGAAANAPTSAPASAPAGGRTRRGPRWERRKESRPSELLQAALEVFVERGFASARLDDVASRAGVSKGTLYLYFDNKEELFKAVVRHSILPLIADFRAIVETSDHSSGALLGQYLQAWWTRYGDSHLSGVAKLCVAESGNFPEVARFWRDEVIGANNALVASILRRGMDQGEFRSIEIEPMVHLIMAPLVLKTLMRDSFDLCCPGSADLDPQQLIGHHLDLLLRALAAPASPDADR